MRWNGKGDINKVNLPLKEQFPFTQSHDLDLGKLELGGTAVFESDVATAQRGLALQRGIGQRRCGRHAAESVNFQGGGSPSHRRVADADRDGEPGLSGEGEEDPRN